MRNPWAPEGTCGESEHVSSHGGGTDYSPPCKQPVGANGRHKGPHIAANGRRWSQAEQRSREATARVMRTFWAGAHMAPPRGMEPNGRDY